MLSGRIKELTESRSASVLMDTSVINSPIWIKSRSTIIHQQPKRQSAWSQRQFKSNSTSLLVSGLFQMPFNAQSQFKHLLFLTILGAGCPVYFSGTLLKHTIQVCNFAKECSCIQPFLTSPNFYYKALPDKANRSRSLAISPANSSAVPDK